MDVFETEAQLQQVVQHRIRGERPASAAPRIDEPLEVPALIKGHDNTKVVLVDERVLVLTDVGVPGSDRAQD